MAEKRTPTKKVGDVVKVAAGADLVRGPDGSVATVRSGGPYQFTAPGTYVIGKAAATGEGITGTTYTVTEAAR